MAISRVTWNRGTDRCEAVVYERDTYRRTGRTKSGFEMHYTKRQCKRKALRGAGGLCAQHYGMSRESEGRR